MGGCGGNLRGSCPSTCTAVTSAAHKLSGVSAVPSAHIPASFGREPSCKPGNRHALKWLSWPPGHKVLAALSTGLRHLDSPSRPLALLPLPGVCGQAGCPPDQQPRWRGGPAPFSQCRWWGPHRAGWAGWVGGWGWERGGWAGGEGPGTGGPQGAAADHGKNARRPWAMLHA